MDYRTRSKEAVAVSVATVLIHLMVREAENIGDIMNVHKEVILNRQ